MMYRILYNKQEIYGPTLDRAVLNPTLELELNTAGKLEFTLPVMRSEARDDDGNPIWPDSIWETIQVFNGEVEVWEEDDCIFFGRPLQIVRDWNNQKKVVCEGALAYFNDTVQPTKEYKKETPLYTGEPYTDPDKYKDGFFNKIIEIHNDQLKKDANWDQTKSIFVGNIDLDNELVWRKTDFETTAECLQSMCLDTNGGYFILRKEWNEDWQDYKKVIDWYKQPPYGTGQEIIFGLNLLDINQDINGSDLCTVLYPTGDGDLTVRKATTRDWNNPYVIDNIDPTTGLHYDTHLIHEENSPYIIHKEGYEKYGRVVKQKSFETNGEEDTHENANELWKKAREWLNEQNFDEVTIECSAADLHYVADQTPYREDAPGKLMLGQMVLVNDSVHGVTRKLPIYKLSMNLDSGVKKITMGTPPKKELTDIIKPSTSSSTRNTTGGNADSGSGSGGSGGGSVTIPVKDVQVKYPDSDEYASVVKKKVAKIDLTSVGKVDDVKVNGTSVVDEDRCAQIDSIVDILVNGASVVNPTDHKARINKSNVTYGTAVPLPTSGANGDVYYRLNQIPTAQTGYKFIKLEIKANKVLVSSAFDGFKFIAADGTPMEWPSNASVTCDVSCTYGADAIFEEENPNKYVLTSAIPTFVIELQDDLDIYTYSKYRWLTSPQAGNNMHEPVSWNLYLSQDGTNWTLVDSVKNADIPSVPGELAYSGDINVGDIVMGMITDIYVKANGIWTKEHFKYTAGDGIVINENNVISLGTMTPPKLIYCMHKNENPNINNEKQSVRNYTNISAPEASTTYSVEDRGLYICSLTCWTSPSDSSAEVTDMDILCYEHNDPTNTKPPMFNVEIGKSIYRIFWAEPGYDIEFVSQGTNVYSYKSIVLMKNVDYHDIVFRRCYDSDSVVPPDHYYPVQPEKGMYPTYSYDGYNSSVKAYRNYRKDVFYLLLASAVGRIKYGGVMNTPDYPTTDVMYNHFPLDAEKGYRYKDDHSIIEFTGETDDRWSGRFSDGAQQGYVAASSEYFLNEDFYNNIYAEYVSFAEFYLTPSMSEVEANPPDAATETLEKLRVNGVTYGVSGGGGDGGFVKATPNMTSDTTPSGEVIYSSYYSSTYPAWKAFNGSDDNGPETWLSSYGDNVGSWIGYHFTESVCVKKVAVSVRNNPSYPHAVKQFKLQGSNDGNTWIDIQECTTTSATALQRDEYVIENNNSYTYYRLYTLEVWDTQDVDQNAAYNQVELYYKQSDLVTEEELDYAVATLQANFQDGVDDIYDACVAKGSTPASHSLSDVVTAIGNISGGGGTLTRYYPSDLLPTLTGPNINVVEASSEYSGYEAWKALDNSVSSYWCSSTTSQRDYIIFHLAHAVYITEILIRIAESKDNTWVMYDNDTNNVIARVSAVTMTNNDWWILFEGTSSNKVQNIRLEANNSSYWKGIAEIYFWGIDGTGGGGTTSKFPISDYFNWDYQDTSRRIPNITQDKYFLVGAAWTSTGNNNDPTLSLPSGVGVNDTLTHLVKVGGTSYRGRYLNMNVYNLYKDDPTMTYFLNQSNGELWFQIPFDGTPNLGTLYQEDNIIYGTTYTITNINKPYFLMVALVRSDNRHGDGEFFRRNVKINKKFNTVGFVFYNNTYNIQVYIVPMNGDTSLEFEAEYAGWTAVVGWPVEVQ